MGILRYSKVGYIIPPVRNVQCLPWSLLPGGRAQKNTQREATRRHPNQMLELGRTDLHPWAKTTLLLLNLRFDNWWDPPLVDPEVHFPREAG